MLQPPRLTTGERWLRFLALLATGLALAWAYHGAEIRFQDLWLYRANMLEYAQGFTRPEFLHWRSYLGDMVTTLQIALWGTALAVLFAIPCSLLASSNISPFWIRQLTRRLMDALRSINELVFALLFVSAIGLGPFAGVMALFAHNLGTLTKLFSEAVESIQEGPLEGVRATGASKIVEIAYGVLPQAMPLWTSYSLYRFESSVRSATVLGIIGAGGIGTPLYEAIRSFNYAETSAILIIIIAAVALLDLASARIRKALL